MKRAQSAVRQTIETDPYIDEAMAMVYVGDVYALVVAEELDGHQKNAEVTKTDTDEDDDHDAVWPFVR